MDLFKILGAVHATVQSGRLGVFNVSDIFSMAGGDEVTDSELDALIAGQGGNAETALVQQEDALDQQIKTLLARQAEVSQHE